MNFNYKPYIKHLEQLKTFHQHRAPVQCAHGLIDFTSSDYLGLRQDPTLNQWASQYCAQFGLGALPSRLLSPNQDAFVKVEEKLAQFIGQPSALIFSTGFQANATALAALLDKSVLRDDPLVFSDRLNHASLHLGCKIAQAKQLRYHHLDLDHLENLLRKHQHRCAPKFILSESLFSMDGDCPDLNGLVDLSEKYGALLYLDQSHALGILGANGQGLIPDKPDFPYVYMGTFSKALGATGAFIGAHPALKEYLINRCSGLIYSNQVSMPTLKLLDRILDIVPKMENARNHLKALNQQLTAGLSKLPYAYLNPKHAIIPLLLEKNTRVLEAKVALEKLGIGVSAIRPPTVPHQSSRLRISLTAQHREEDIHKLLEALHWWAHTEQSAPALTTPTA